MADKVDNILKINSYSMAYGPVKVLNNINFELKKGECVTLIGANGAGKSTLLRSILNLHRATSGSIFFYDVDITHIATDKIVGMGICLIPEGHGIFRSLTVLENLQLGAYHNAEDTEVNLSLVYDVFPVLRDRRKQQSGTLSGGEQQMLSIGRALMAKPMLIMVDEPSLGLAPKMVASLFSIISNLNDKGYTILLAEQNVKKSLEIADRGYVLELGNIVLTGDSNDLIQNERIQQAYLGGSA